MRAPILYSTFKARLEKLGRSLNLLRRDGSVMRLIPSLLRCLYSFIFYQDRGDLGRLFLREAANRTAVDALGPLVAATVRFLLMAMYRSFTVGRPDTR